MGGEPEGRRLGVRTVGRIRARLFDEAGCVTDAYVLDHSVSGIRIETPFGASVARRFRVAFSGREHLAEIVWRRGIELGAGFVAPDEAGESSGRARPVEVRKTSLAELRNLARGGRR